jgi:hypothetical protein
MAPTNRYFRYLQNIYNIECGHSKRFAIIENGLEFSIRRIENNLWLFDGRLYLAEVIASLLDDQFNSDIEETEL